VWTSLRESPLFSKRYLVSSSSICAGFFSVSGGLELGDGADCCASDLGAGFLVGICDGQSGAAIRVVMSKIKINGHRLKPAPLGLFGAVPMGTEFVVADGATQEV
jgi:hypothetical protein